MQAEILLKAGTVEQFPAQKLSTLVSDELNRILDLLWREVPDPVKISFEFEAKLFVHIDVRTVEDVSLTKAKLQNLGGGLFTDIRHGKTPHRAFLHRVSAVVTR